MAPRVGLTRVPSGELLNTTDVTMVDYHLLHFRLQLRILASKQMSRFDKAQMRLSYLSDIDALLDRRNVLSRERADNGAQEGRSPW